MKRLLFAFSLLFAISVMACNEKTPTAEFAPSIEAAGTTAYKIKTGQEISFRPRCKNNDGATYSWIMNGSSLSTNSSLTYTFEEVGEFTILFEVKNSLGSDTQTYTVEVEQYVPFAPPTAPVGMKWEAVPELTDEFDTWDKSKWTWLIWDYGVPVHMVKENGGISDGNLWIKATLNDANERWFESSRLTSTTKIGYPMYMECSMKASSISGYNTFWLNNGNSEARDEIDMCENNARPTASDQDNERPYTLHSSTHIAVDFDDEHKTSPFDNRELSSSNELKGVRWDEAYHTIGVWWINDSHIQFYLNGEPAGSIVTTRKFTREMSVIWDLWTVDASWIGGLATKESLLDDSLNTMYVDWIHTFKLVPDDVQKSGNVEVQF